MKKRIVIGLIALGLCVAVANRLLWHGEEETSHAEQHGSEVHHHEEPCEHGEHEEQKHEEPCEHEEHDGLHEHHDHGGEEGSADLSMSVEEILRANCEHDMKTYQCPECRYEVGVVKADASLLKDSQGSGDGLLRTVAVSREMIDTEMNVTGEVQLNENAHAHISPRIPGIIRSVRVDMGAQVKTDDILFEIESVELGQALSEYEKNRAMKELSQRNFDRERSLFERKIASERDMIDAQMMYEQYQTELKAAEQKLRVLGLREKDIAAEERDARKISAGLLPVRAPLDGMIIEKDAVVGEQVEPGNPIMLLADLSTLWVWADIYERDLAQLIESKDQGEIPIEVQVHAFPGRAFEGEIDYIGATMDEMTRTVKVRATVRNDHGLLRPGMFCEVRVLVKSAEPVLSIPKVAFLSDDGHDFVFKNLKDDFYVRRPVKKGRDFADRVEILTGLRPGEKIVVDGAFLLKSDVLRWKMGAGCAD